MSSGDIDDVLGPEGELDKLRTKHPQLNVYLEYVASRPVVRAGVPFAAGISKSGQTIYLDHRLDTIVNNVDVSLALSTHEQVEWALREYAEIGVDYETDLRGHRLANRAEYECVAKLFPEFSPTEAWEMYDEHIDPQVRKIEGLPLQDCPSDLATYPYEHDKEMMEKIRKAQNEGTRFDRTEAG